MLDHCNEPDRMARNLLVAELQFEAMLSLKDLLHWNIVIAVILSSTLICNEYIIEQRVSSVQYSEAEAVPYNRVGLVLGTLPTSHDKGPNPFFWARVEAAAELYCSGKVDHLILSGDGWIWGVNEPEEMRTALIDMGIPDRDMTLDYAGIDTFRSVVRAKRVFGEEAFTIVSQPGHAARALFIAKEIGVRAIAYHAKDMPAMNAKRSWLRERGSRLKMWLNLIPTTSGDAMNRVAGLLDKAC